MKFMVDELPEYSDNCPFYQHDMCSDYTYDPVHCPIHSDRSLRECRYMKEYKEPKNYADVEFVSYDGKYPNLCSGTLVLRIAGKEVKFGGWEPGSYPRFWESGGCCGEYVRIGAWASCGVPKEFKEYEGAMIQCMNDNVECGCCGGCE